MKIALVHDYINQYGGAERVLEAFMDMYPDAPVYTLISDLSKMPERFRQVDIRNSFIQSVPFSRKLYKHMINLFPIAIEQFDLREFDVILSTSSAFAKGVLTNPNQLHISYCHTPMRYVWDLYHQYVKEDIKNPLFKFVLPLLLHSIRNWDQLSSRRVDHFIANSLNVAKRIEKYYGRPSQVIYPPVNFDQYYKSDQIKDYFLVVSRLLPYKRVDTVIEAFNQLKKPLIIIGDGYDRKRLESLAGSNITFLGYQSDETIAKYYSECQAFIMAGEEDFGITPLEAQASGRPVIAYRMGGSLETVIEGQTGLFFNEQKPESLLHTIQQFSNDQFDSDTIRNHALAFSTQRFKQEIAAFIHQKIRGDHNENETY
jgi:glycosyltransferase involved in cell wall biosynthesis